MTWPPAYPQIVLPAELAGHEILASVSGGKDSTAMLLALREAAIPHRAVFADTGWEHPAVYEYLDLLRERLCPIDVVGAQGGMVARMRHRAGFPSRVQRWCTRELKIEPLREYAGAVEDETGRPAASAVGVRAAESQQRSGLDALEREADGPRAWGHWVWRPLITWSVEEVLRIHAAHGLPVNPLYQAGASRVGCWPCIYAGKPELRLVADTDPGRIDEIRGLEHEFTQLRASRNAETPGRYAHAQATFFQTRTRNGPVMDIDAQVEWSRTKRGGVEFEPEPPVGGCLRWGLCDTGDGS